MGLVIPILRKREKTQGKPPFSFISGRKYACDYIRSSDSGYAVTSLSWLVNCWKLLEKCDFLTFQPPCPLNQFKSLVTGLHHMLASLV